MTFLTTGSRLSKPSTEGVTAFAFSPVGDSFDSDKIVLAGS